MARARELAIKLRLYARDEVRALQCDWTVTPDIVDVSDLGRWADIKDEAATLLDLLADQVMVEPASS